MLINWYFPIRILLTLLWLVCMAISIIPVRAQIVDNKEPGQLRAEKLDNLSDEDRHLSKTYIDEAGAQEMLEKECAKLGDPNICRGAKAKTKFNFLGLKINADMVRALGKAYALVLPALSVKGGGNFKRSKLSLKGKKGTSGKSSDVNGSKNSDKKNMHDYCQYIAAGVEVISQFNQKKAQENMANLPSNQATKQKEILYKAARNHRERAKNYRIQAYGWGATTACYSYYVVNAARDYKVYLKMGAAGLLTLFFASEAKAHDGYGDKVRAIADKLPGPGHCNPVTMPNCFCSKSKVAPQDVALYKKYCFPKLRDKALAQQNVYEIPCVNEQLKADEKCICVGQESCFDDAHFRDINLPEFTSFMNSPKAQGIKNMYRGHLNDAELSSHATDKLVAKTKKLLGQFPAKEDMLPYDMSKKNMKLAKQLNSIGIPLPTSALLAHTNVKAPSEALARFNSVYSGHSAVGRNSRNRKKGRTLRFSNVKDHRSSGKNVRDYDFLNKLKKGKSNRKYSSEVLKFASKASDMAQVNKNVNTSIFDIVSHRYRISAPNKLGKSLK